MSRIINLCPKLTVDWSRQIRRPLSFIYHYKSTIEHIAPRTNIIKYKMIPTPQSTSNFNPDSVKQLQHYTINIWHRVAARIISHFKYQLRNIYLNSSQVHTNHHYCARIRPFAMWVLWHQCCQSVFPKKYHKLLEKVRSPTKRYGF